MSSNSTVWFLSFVWTKEFLGQMKEGSVLIVDPRVLNLLFEKVSEGFETGGGEGNIYIVEI